MKNSSRKTDLQQLVAGTLRWGVAVACLIAFVGGVMYLCLHGGEPMPDYTHFSYDEKHPTKAGYLEWWIPAIQAYLYDYLG